MPTDAAPKCVSYIRFDVYGMGVDPPVVVRIRPSRSNSVGSEVYGVADTTWDEPLLAYNNCPPLGRLVGASGPVASGNWYTVDVFGGSQRRWVAHIRRDRSQRQSHAVQKPRGCQFPDLLTPAPAGSSHYVVSKNGGSPITGTTPTGDLKVATSAGGNVATRIAFFIAPLSFDPIRKTPGGWAESRAQPKS